MSAFSRQFCQYTCHVWTVNCTVITVKLFIYISRFELCGMKVCMTWTGVPSESLLSWRANTTSFPQDGRNQQTACNHHVGSSHRAGPPAACEPSTSRGDQSEQAGPEDQPAAVHAESSDQNPVAAPVRLAFLPACRCGHSWTTCE